MCGVSGQAGYDAPGALEDVRRGVRLLRHRGPDASGLVQLDGCVLGHTRLRVIDTRSAADQPMRLQSAGLSVVFNGEIYNFQKLRAELQRAGHRFTTQSDTEVILHLYEEDDLGFVEKLEGMFAFALWDEHRARLVLARDRLGIKPLYYRLSRDGIAFASEVGCLVSARSGLRPSAIASYLRVGWVGGPETIYADVYELLPGRLLRWQDGRSSVTRYWPGPAPAGSPECSANELSDAVRAAVRRQLVADVPVGLFLSSGVDSAVLARLLAEEAPGARTFTVAFDTGPDETAAAAVLARRLHLDHTVVQVTGSAVLADLDAIIRRMGQPTVDGVNSWVISRAVREAGMTVALSGLGGDELFRGYSTFRHAPRIARVGRIAQHVPESLGTSALRALGRTSRIAGSRGMRVVEAALHGGYGAAYAAVRGLFSVRDLHRIWPDISTVLDPADGMLSGHLPSGTDQVAALELSNYLPFQLLRDTDAMSMAHALEVRVPLLDDLVVDAVLRRQWSGRTPFDKSALVDAADPELRNIARNPKRTFTLPFDSWLRGPLRDRVQASVRSLANTSLGLDRRALVDVLCRFDNGHLGWRCVWGLAVLGEWLSAAELNKAASWQRDERCGARPPLPHGGYSPRP
jgi:asparagine synthase (glutamine-hydrolysing)